MELDLGDPGLLLRDDVLADPRPFYDLLRAEAPVWQIPGQDTFLVSDPRLIREAVARPEDFSNNLVSLLHNDGTGCPVPFAMAAPGDPIHVLSTADPPLHTRHRRLLQAHLSPSAVAALEAPVTGIVDDYLDAVLAAGRVDAVAAFSDPVPARTICEVIGLPASDAPAVLGFASGTGALLDGITDLDGMTAAIGSAIGLAVFVQNRLHESLDQPADQRRGLLAVFAEGIDAGETTAGEVRDMLITLVTAGSETTASLLAAAIETLARNPELQDHLRRNTDQIPEAIEVILREDGPFQFHYRYVPADTTLGGVDIPVGSRVMLMWAAANRPAPSETTDARTDDRGPAPHFAFGRGLHFCIGASIARLETRVALERLLDRTSSITLDPDGRITRRPSIFIRRHASLPVVVRPR